MPKILVIGQALPAVPQQYPYDTTMLYDWLQELNVSKDSAQNLFAFEAVYAEFPGVNKNGGHLKPTKQQMLDHWNNTLETKIQMANRIWVLGNVAKEFIDRMPRTWSCNSEWLYTMHPSRRNYYKFSLDKDSILNQISLFLNGKGHFKKETTNQQSLF